MNSEISPTSVVDDHDERALHLPSRRSLLLAGTTLAAGTALGKDAVFGPAHAQQPAAAAGQRPNILVIFGDDVGWQNLSAYGLGVMGYRTPNLDRIAKEGAMFVDHYAQPSCTAGRAAFITGSYPIRCGMTTVGLPGDKLGLKAGTPTLADTMKAQGYATGQFGKNHLGDNNEHLPTVHGFDEFFGNLYHLNTQEESEQRDYKAWAEKYGPDFEKKFGTRGVLDCVATDTDDPTVDPRFGKVGKQRIRDTGPLTAKRMENFDAAEVIPRAFDFMKKNRDANKPFFVWLNTSRMHLYTRLSEADRYLAEKFTSEADIHGSGMLQHDRDMGTVLKWLDDNGLTQNTVVVYTTDNGPEHSSWPHGATTPFRSEKMTTYEGGVRVPCMIRWPGQIPAGQVLNGIQTHEDLHASLAAAAGVADLADRLKGQSKWYLDGLNNLDYWRAKTPESKREFYIFYNESNVAAVRFGPWKWHFITSENYYGTPKKLGKPLVFNIRMDPFESYDSVDAYGHLLQKVSWQFAPISEKLKEHLQTLIDFPPAQGGGSFDVSKIIDEAIKKGQQ
ncbi:MULTISPECIES: sulfatase-like hydrolase/transferase [unclassified Bosea (in: a-proteobacteria)]|uniref:sulfatase-like hydrolase/transferase n=1 Tax=unclassified Bosea (in: a-proteobacteria) TaxID=2653178 RepID=UPI000F7F571B|nr:MULTISPECIES: sulfatase-like hydrolase/transferase [unclassified Bosea (in: a-proteobacteria)]RXT23219.1 arylsulfatase [Bosea sp. Tri-39]RXT38691.1 arylsulfatase [Bosea sp. Tri-54]